MAFSLTQQLQSLGVPSEMGQELQRQIDTSAYNAQKLIYASWTPELAQYMATTLAVGTFKASVAVEWE